MIIVSAFIIGISIKGVVSDKTVINVRGSLNYTVQREFKSIMVTLSGDPDKTVEVNLGAVDVIESSGLGILILLKESAAEGQKLRIVNASPVVLSVLKSAFLNEMYEIPQLA